MNKYVLVIDEGTTGTRALIYNKAFEVVSQAYAEFAQLTQSLHSLRQRKIKWNTMLWKYTIKASKCVKKLWKKLVLKQKKY